MGFEFAGLNEFRSAFERFRAQGRQRAGEGIKEHLELRVKPLADELVPKLTGALMDTARVEQGETELQYKIKYGNSPVNNRSMVDYAAAVHEREDVQHAPPTTYKFLIRPLKETAHEIPERVGKKLDELIQEG